MKLATPHLSHRAGPGFAAALLAAATLALAACAAVPVPTDAITGAETAIKRAEEARVADYASPELTSAREKLVAARGAVDRNDMALAEQLATQSKLDAEVATAKAEAIKAQSNIQEMQKANQAIRQESQRNASPAAPIILPAPPASNPPNGGTKP